MKNRFLWIGPLLALLAEQPGRVYSRDEVIGILLAKDLLRYSFEKQDGRFDNVCNDEPGQFGHG